jgi:NADPH:quinone reductase-like Zn-dependent oxidoreductase
MRTGRLLSAGLLASVLCTGFWSQSHAQQPPATMQAVVVIDGKPKVQSVARPAPGPGEVLVKVRAAGVNPADWKRAERTPNSMTTPGWDIAGVISDVGPGVTSWKAGDAVMGFFEATGGYAQYAVINVDSIARKSEKLSFEQAAGVPLAAVTAWKALVDVADLRQGQRVLIHGAAGGVGSAAVQIAAARGAYVIATASERNHAFLKTIGAKETIDYNKERFEDRVHDLDVAMNTVDEETARRSLNTLKLDGMMVTVAGAVPTEKCTAAHVRCGSPNRKVGTPIGQLLAEVGRLADAGKFSINVDAQFPMEKTADAWELSKAGHTRGKIVLILPP